MTDVELYVRNTADWTLDHSAIMKLRGIGEPYTVKCPFYLVDHPEGVVLYDTGVDYEMQADPSSYGTHGAPHMEQFMSALEMAEDQRIDALLNDLGYTPNEVDYVVMSHLHVDHAGNIDAFPDATFILQQEELSYAWWPADPIQKSFYLEGDFGVLRSHDTYEVHPIEGEYDVFGDGSVVCYPTPGHTPGHQSLLLRRGDKSVILGGDVAHLEAGYEQELFAVYNWDARESISSVRKLKELQHGENASVYFLHDADHYEALLEPEAE